MSLKGKGHHAMSCLLIRYYVTHTNPLVHGRSPSNVIEH